MLHPQLFCRLGCNTSTPSLSRRSVNPRMKTIFAKRWMNATAVGQSVARACLPAPRRPCSLLLAAQWGLPGLCPFPRKPTAAESGALKKGPSSLCGAFRAGASRSQGRQSQQQTQHSGNGKSPWSGTCRYPCVAPAVSAGCGGKRACSELVCRELKKEATCWNSLMCVTTWTWCMGGAVPGLGRNMGLSCRDLGSKKRTTHLHCTRGFSHEKAMDSCLNHAAEFFNWLRALHYSRFAGR